MPEGHDFGPYIEHKGEGLAPSFTLDLSHEVPYNAGGVHPHTALMLFALAVNLRPGVIVETGTFYGYSTIYLAKACDLWDQGTVYTLDPEDKLIAPCVKSHPRVQCIKERSVDCLPRLLTMLGQVDLAFIDSWKRLALWEFLQIAPFVPEGGLIVFHDTQLFNSGRTLHEAVRKVADGFDVMLFAGTPRDDNPHAYYGNADDRGLLVLRRREEDPYLDVADADNEAFGVNQVFPRTTYLPVRLGESKDGE
jgi:predicted O-methyltransferase YrrM